MQSLILIALGCIFSASMFYFTEVNLDSEVRIAAFHSSSVGSSTFMIFLMKEPFTLLAAYILHAAGFGSAYSLQLFLYLIIVFCMMKILRERMLFFPLMIVIPSISLLAFNTQPMMISMLIVYYVLIPKQGSQSKPRSLTSYFTWLLIAVGFHWVSLIFFPYILLREKYYSSLLVLGLIVVSQVFLLDAAFFTALTGKMSAYKEVASGTASIMHVQIILSLAVVFMLLNWCFRWDNHRLRIQVQFYLFVVSLVLLTTTVIGYKAGSRIAFILDLWIILDFFRYWIPKSIKAGPVITFSSPRMLES